jgi:hypothetical protein
MDPSKDPSKPFSVNLWESHPDEENDDCSTGEDFATEAEARACIANLDGTFNPVYYRNTPFIELDGPGLHEVTERPGVKKRRAKENKLDDDMARSEFAMQQGMGLGIEAYNDAIGSGTEPYEESQDQRDYQEHLRDMRREQSG